MATMFTSFRFVNHSPKPARVRLLSNAYQTPLTQRCPANGSTPVEYGLPYACDPSADKQIHVMVIAEVDAIAKIGVLDAPPGNTQFFNSLQADMLPGPDYTLILTATFGQAKAEGVGSR